MASARAVLLGSWLSYRALFTWLNPLGYVSSRVVMPLALTLIFGTVGRYTQGSPTGAVVGGVMITVAFASIFGVTLSMANERTFGTLGAWLATPQRLGTSIVVKALPHLVDGLLGASWTFAIASLAFDIRVPAAALAGLLACALVAGLSTAGLGLMAAAFSVRFRDVFTAPNIAENLLIVCGGALVPASSLPSALAAVGAVLPLGRSIAAARGVAAGGPLDLGLLAGDLVIGLVWGVLGYAFLSAMVRGSRRSGAYGLV